MSVSPPSIDSGRQDLGGLRDNGMTALTREKMKNRISLVKLSYDYKRYNQMHEDASIRRAIIKDLMDNHPDINDIDFETLMEMDITTLYSHIERRKIIHKMVKSAVMIQR